MKNNKNIERKEKAIRYIDSQISQLNNEDLMKYFLKTKKAIKKDLDKTPQKRFREAFSINVNRNTRNSRTNMKNAMPQRNPQKIKNAPKKSLKRTVFYGIIAGAILGIPTGSISYNYVKNQPSPHNYITVEEARNGITDRKDHDSSKYKKYIMEKYNLTEKEAIERIQKEEAAERWGR